MGAEAIEPQSARPAGSGTGISRQASPTATGIVAPQGQAAGCVRARRNRNPPMTPATTGSVRSGTNAAIATAMSGPSSSKMAIVPRCPMTPTRWGRGPYST